MNSDEFRYLMCIFLIHLTPFSVEMFQILSLGWLFSYPIALKHIAVSVSFSKDHKDMDIYPNRVIILKAREGKQTK